MYTLGIHILPILNAENKLIYVYIQMHDHIKEYLKYLPYLNEIRKYDCFTIQDYLRLKQYKKIAIWGIYHVTLELCEEVAKYSDITVVGLYDRDENRFNGEWSCKNRRNPNMWIDAYNYDFNHACSYDVSLNSLFNDSDLDCIIIANGDDLEKGKLLSSLYPSVKMINVCDFLNDILKEQEYFRYQCSIFKLEQQGVKHFTVGIPNSGEEFGCDKKNELRRNEISLGEFENEDELKLFQKELHRRTLMYPRGKLRIYGDYRSNYINCTNGESVWLLDNHKMNIYIQFI